MRRFLAMSTAVAVGVWLLGSVGSASSKSSRWLTPEYRLEQRIQSFREKPFKPQKMILKRFQLVGHSDLGADIDFGDVYGHGNYAYVGTRCGDTLRGGGGVRVVDISDPANPTVVSTLPNPAYTRAEDVTVLTVDTPNFTGDLAVVGIQACIGSGHNVVTGLRFFDVNDPASPTLLGQWGIPSGQIGCHEIDAVQRADGQVLAVCARNLLDTLSSGGAVAIHLIDATDPSNPVTVVDWSKNLDPQSGFGCIPYVWAHSARFEDQGRSLYVSYWDAGTVNLNISNPASPVEVGTTTIAPPDEDGDNHSMTLANGGKWLIINPEDGSPADCPGVNEFGTFGEAYVYDNTNPSSPTLLGTFATDNTRSTRPDGTFDVHNTEVAFGNQFFSSWYTDGIVWWTMRADGVSHQLGQFVPPSGQLGPPFVWGVYIDSGSHLILASDILSGLWIVKPVGLKGFQP